MPGTKYCCYWKYLDQFTQLINIVFSLNHDSNKAIFPWKFKLLIWIFKETINSKPTILKLYAFTFFKNKNQLIMVICRPMPPYGKKDLIPKKQIVKNLKLKILLIPYVVFWRVFKERALCVIVPTIVLMMTTKHYFWKFSLNFKFYSWAYIPSINASKKIKWIKLGFPN